jgi:hypothetical protein
MRQTLGAILALLPFCLSANIDLDIRPDAQTVYVGDTVQVGLYAVSDTSYDQLTAAMDVIVQWDPVYLNPISYSIVGAGYSWFQHGFLYPGGLNASLADGDAIWTCFAAPGTPAAATPEGLLVCTFIFQAQAATDGTAIWIPRTLGGYTTVVYDGTEPNLDVTGTLDPGAIVTILPTAPVTGHVDLEFYVGGAGIGSTLEFREPGTQNVLYSRPITLDASGNYTAANVPVGTYDVALKFVNWLRQVHQDVTVALPSTSVDFALTNGDADDSNQVDLVDMNTVLTNFGTVGPLGDLTWDDSVDLPDLNIVLVNFGKSGDP